LTAALSLHRVGVEVEIDAVATFAEREAIVRGYATLAGYATEQVNS
jgi:hypothetical protein